MTRLKWLELFGFKSFADRTRFEFPDGITVVVGPNGSGKSNVVDAIKWVLGEQSVRSLRGREMTDVIFAGSVARKPLNSAETTLAFDNSGRQLPVDSDEVQIGRRVYRNGENEYLINGEVCRLRDIRDLFSGTGAATEAYSVIEQGRVDALLVASGKDRRAVFEEAAGITKFRARRTEALRRLERAEQNRQRLADIVGEVAARLETVRHQAARARRWRQMTDRLRCLRIVAARQDLAGVDAAVHAVEKALGSLQQEFVDAEAAVVTATQLAQSRAAEDLELSPQVEEARTATGIQRQQAAAAGAQLHPLRQRVAEWEAEAARAAEEERQAAARLRAAVAAATSATATSGAITTELADLEARLADCQLIANGSHSDATAARGRLDALSLRLENRLGERQRLLLEADRADARHDEAKRAATEHRARIDTARHRVTGLAEGMAFREGHVDALRKKLEATAADIAAAESDVRTRTAALDAGWREMAGWQAKLEACRERKGLLEEFAGRHEGIAEAARRLLAAGTAANEPNTTGIRGIVGESIDSPLEWAGLVDVALGNAAQDIVVDSLGAFTDWLESWVASDSGRAALTGGGRIGIVSATGLPADGTLDLNACDGVVGRLDRLVAPDADAPGNAIVHQLLAKAWVVETFADACRLAPLHPQALFVARDGRSCSGARIEIGSTTGTIGLVARRAELRSLVERHDELTRRTESHAATVTTLQADLADAGQTVRQIQGRKQHEAEGVAAARAEAARLTREHESACEALASAEAALAEADRRSGETSAIRESIGDALALVDAEIAALREQREQTERSIANLDLSRGSLTEEIHHLRIELATGRERLARAEHDVAARTADAAEKHSAVDAIRTRADTIRGRLAAAEIEVLMAEARLADAAWATERAEEAFIRLASRLTAVRASANDAQAAAEASRSEVARFAERIHARELEAGETRHRRVRIVERIRDEYDIDIESAEAFPPPAPHGTSGDQAPEEIPADRQAIDSGIEELKRKLATMTTVNLEALAESEQLAERLAGLEAQLSDVTGAKQSIEQLIARIDDESRRLLAETIETVRGHFRALFERVFGGGQADIVLEPGVDVLETSVEIVARPPGKEPRSISLLSGGEKTMTCVALLLAIFRSRPSPFCVLDEVDAALDEANVERFVGVLREFKNTQIIVVTHRKTTMAAAHTLYGVTMEESGVSKRVSVRFEAAAATAPAPARAAA